MESVSTPHEGPRGHHPFDIHQTRPESGRRRPERVRLVGHAVEIHLGVQNEAADQELSEEFCGASSRYHEQADVLGDDSGGSPVHSPRIGRALQRVANPVDGMKALRLPPR